MTNPQGTEQKAVELTLAEMKAIAARVVLEACECDPADADHPDTILIRTCDLEEIVRGALEDMPTRAARPLDTRVSALVEALAPFAEVALWAERNGHDLLANFDMLLRNTSTGQFSGHLQAQAADFIRAAKAHASFNEGGPVSAALSLKAGS